MLNYTQRAMTQNATGYRRAGYRRAGYRRINDIIGYRIRRIYDIIGYRWIYDIIGYRQIYHMKGYRRIYDSIIGYRRIQTTPKCDELAHACRAASGSSVRAAPLHSSASGPLPFTAARQGRSPSLSPVPTLTRPAFLSAASGCSASAPDQEQRPGLCMGRYTGPACMGPRA
jgi:hypothetical protein